MIIHTTMLLALDLLIYTNVHCMDEKLSHRVQSVASIKKLSSVLDPGSLRPDPDQAF